MFHSVRLLLVATMLLAATAARAIEPPRVAVLLIGEEEYGTRKSLPAFAKEELASRHRRFSIASAGMEDRNSFTGLEALTDADLLIMSVRRRTPKKDDLDAIRRYVASGRPIIALRTSSHAFALRGDKQPPPGHADWPEFDAEVLGGNYHNHHGNTGPDAKPTMLRLTDAASKHPLGQGLPQQWTSRSSLYKTSPVAADATILLTGSIEGVEKPEPVAWVRLRGKQRIVYIALGSQEDFRTPAFRRLLKNAIDWAMTRPR